MRLLFRHAWKFVVAVNILLLLSGAQPRTGVTLASPGPAPILLVVNDAYAGNKFGRYLGEILRAEGLPSFDAIDLSALTVAELSQHDLAILAETTLTSAQASTLTTYVSGGGRLLALRPDAQIKNLFDLGASAGTLTDGYLKIIDTAALNGNLPGQGLVTATLQIHGGTDRYTPLGGAVVLARLYSNASTSTTYPAVVSGSTGRSIAFTYDLSRNVILTRQGNPANGNVDVDGDGVLRTIDLFQTVGNPGAPWVDRNRIAVPQADEQQRLFARLVKQLVGEARPLPQLWYFPGTAKTMLILTADAHANPQSYYQTEIDSINAYGGKVTFYLSTGGGILNNAVMQSWRAQGHEFGIHPYRNPDLAGGYNASEDTFAFYYSSPKSRTVRNHQVAWLGWADAADIAVAHNIALDTDFYHWGPWLQKTDSTWPHGYITGSGQPMKFIKADGTILPLYQQLTQLVDEQLLGGIGFEGLSSAQAISVSQQLMDASQAGDHAALMTQFHVDYYGSGYPQDWAEGTLAYANANGVPIWNADRWLSFTETRHDANYTDVAWNSGTQTLSFNLTATPTVGITLTTLLPLSYGGNSLQAVTVDSLPQAYSVQTVKGVNVAFVAVPAGNHSFTAIYQAVTPSPTPTPSATPTFTLTPSHTPTASNTPTRTPTFTLTPSHTPTASNTPTPTPTFTLTPSSTPTNTATRTPTFTLTPSGTPTASNTPTQIPTFTLTPSVTPTPSITPTPSNTSVLKTPAFTPTITATSTAFVPITGNHQLFLPLIFGAGAPDTAGSFALGPDNRTSQK